MPSNEHPHGRPQQQAQPSFADTWCRLQTRWPGYRTPLALLHKRLRGTKDGLFLRRISCPYRLVHVLVLRTGQRGPRLACDILASATLEPLPLLWAASRWGLDYGTRGSRLLSCLLWVWGHGQSDLMDSQPASQTDRQIDRH